VTICDEADVRASHLDGGGVLDIDKLDPPATWEASILDHVDGLAWFREVIRDRSIVLVGHNLAFDACVMIQEDPSLFEPVFDAYLDDRMVCTQRRQQLMDIAEGVFRGRLVYDSEGTPKFIPYRYALDALAMRHFKWKIPKDEWRLTYGEVRGVPIETWAEGRREYPKTDAKSTLAVCLFQEWLTTDPEAIEHLDSGDWLRDQYRQARRFFALALEEAWGLRTNPAKVEAFAIAAAGRVEEIKGELIEIGLVRVNGSRDTKAAARLMVQVCEEKQIAVLPTKGAEEKIKAGEVVEDGTGVALDRDACKRADDWRLSLYADFVSAKKVLGTDVKILREGAVQPIHTRFDIAETTRNTSSGPNLQNLATLGGVRECFEARPGWVFAQGDYPSGELHTLAQWSVDRFGYSALGDILNAGRDPHLEFAARMLGVEYAEAKQRLRDGDPVVKKFRKMAKPFNFGKPGGMGDENFIKFASKHPYYVTLSMDEAKHYGKLWLDTLPEMVEHFRYSSQLAKSGRPIRYSRSPGIRGDYMYTSASNDGFQRLLADIMTDVEFEVARACYVDKRSPLYGTRPVNSIHDEKIAETWDDTHASTKGARASAAVVEMCRIMTECGNRWCPDVPFAPGVEPVLMDHWSKDAESIIDAGGIVRVWKGKVAA
jgi:hypothetical protein